MKIRNGFVSNSSSSSYIIYGFFKEDLPEDILKQFEDCSEDFGWKKELYDRFFYSYVHGGDYEIIGNVMACWEDYGEVLGNLDFSSEAQAAAKEKVKDQFKELTGYELPDSIFKFIGTTYYS